MKNIQKSILSLPKAEQHVHLEAAISTDLARKLSKRNNVTIPAELFGEDGHFICQDYHHFLKVYDDVASVVKTQADYFEITYDYLKRSHAQNVIYNELFLSSDHAKMNGVTYEAMLEGTVRGIEKAKADFGIESRIIMVLVRHLGLDAVNQTAQDIIKHPHPLVAGVTCAGDELQLSPSDLKPAYEKLKAAGLKLTLHVGEICGPEKIWQAINDLPLDRIGHGVRSIEDPDLVAMLAQKQIPLEICITSNVFVGTYERFDQHPFLKLLNAGVKLSLNSDDPSFFATTIGHEYQVAHDLGASYDQLLEITRQAISSGFAEDAVKQRLLTQVNAFSA